MNDSDRIQEVKEYQKLNLKGNTELNEIAKIASAICETPISLITFLDEQTQWIKASFGFQQKKMPRDIAICNEALHNKEEVLVVEDLANDTRFQQNPLVVNDPRFRFYAGAPLKTPRGNVLGAVCVIDTQQRAISEEKKEALRLLSKKAMRIFNAEKIIMEQSALIKESAQNLKYLTDQSPGVIFQFMITKQGEMSFPFLSRGFEKMHPKLESNEVKLNPELAFKVIHPEDIPKVRASIQESFENLTEWYIEFRVRQPNGKIEWYMGRSKPEQTKEGGVIWYGTFQNITKRVEYAKTLESIAFDISHVLRRPVANLLGLINLVESQNDVDVEQLLEFKNHIKIVSNELDEYTRKLNDNYLDKKRVQED